MKKVIRLTEDELRGMIKDGVNEALNELSVKEQRKKNKESFRILHKKASNMNEDVMNRFYGIKSNRNKPVRIDEVTLDRVLKKHGNNGMINISANRSDEPQDVNDKNTKELIRDLKRSGYSYLPTYGGYRGADGEEGDYEPSFVVFNYDVNGNAGDFDELRQFALTLCGKYNQDCVLIKAPGEAPIYVDSEGNKINSRESSNTWKNDPSQTYFTSFKSKDSVDDEVRAKLMGKYKSYCNANGIPKTKEGFEEFSKSHLGDIDSIGKRYTYDIGFDECYVNPMPCQLTERMRRKGEVMIWE
jgi:hypothetical protein